MKETAPYEKAKLEVVVFGQNDVITQSPKKENEGEWDNPNG